MGEENYRVFVVKSGGKYHLEDKSVDGRMIIKLILNLMGRRGLD